MLSYPSAPQLTKDHVSITWKKLSPYLRKTLLLHSSLLSTKFDCQITFACETFQHTGSFKFRAAYNLLSNVPHQHIITASSGNFGKAVAHVSRLLGKTCTVVMSAKSDLMKIEAVRSNNGIVELIDVNQISRTERCQQIIEANPKAFYAQSGNDYRAVAGNSTLGKEILDASKFDIIVAPIGTGGLCSGLVVARDYMHASTAIVGVEPLLANDAVRSFKEGKLLLNYQESQTVADGARTIGLGELNWEILRHGLLDIVEVSESSIIEALRYLFTYANLKAEPTGALALGALLTNPNMFRGKHVCFVVSGGNVDPYIYAKALLE